MTVFAFLVREGRVFFNDFTIRVNSYTCIIVVPDISSSASIEWPEPPAAVRSP